MPAYDSVSFTPPAPVARVTVRCPDGEPSISDVRMLIDSGADVTLIPRPAATSIGLVGAGRRYQLVAFDGSTSESEAVQADLVFLNMRFRGRYLLIDGETGIIGRDVLNHLRLILDGPALTWDAPAQLTKQS
jgi:hypothetical protein